MVHRTPREKLETIVAFCRSDAALNLDRVRDYLRFTLSDNDPDLLAMLNEALTVPVKRPRGRPPKKRVNPTPTEQLTTQETTT